MSEFEDDSHNETDLEGIPTKEARPNKGRPLPPKETRWKKGVSGNPHGRPKKGDSLTDIMRETLRKKCLTDREKRTWGELLVQALIHSALKGNATASKLILERHDRKDAQAENRSGEDYRGRKKPVQQGLTREQMNRIRDIYGLPHVEEEEKQSSAKDPKAERDNDQDTDS